MKVEKGDMVMCCITGDKMLATQEIVDEITGGDPDWVLICKKNDPKFQAMKIHLKGG